jgi:Uma2 family endonuclease
MALFKIIQPTPLFVNIHTNWTWNSLKRFMTITQSRDNSSPSAFITPAQFEQLCQNNPDIRLELTATGSLTTMAPAGWESSERNGNLIALGILINPQDNQIEVYRLGREVEVLISPTMINCEDVLPGFILDLTNILTTQTVCR